MISIITVVYNGEHTIKDTLDSVCNQSLLPLEYIIIDGLSNDNTIAIIEEYMLKYPFIKLFSEKDEGIYDAMNKGISKASGNLIGIINSDDWYELNALEKMYQAYTVHGPGVYYGIQRNILGDKEYYLERVSVDFISQKMIQHPSTFVSSDIYKRHGLFNLNFKYSSDLDLIIRYYNQKVSFFVVDSIISNFRIGGASSTPKAALESIKIRMNNGLLTKKEYYTKLIKVKIKMLMS